MFDRRRFVLSACALVGCAASTTPMAAPPKPTPGPGITDLPEDPDVVEPITRSDEDWRKILDESSYDVLRHEGTERAFTGATWDEHRPGVYVCAGCGLRLFDAKDKFDSGTGWPSFSRPVKKGRVTEKSDMAYGMVRTEVVCSRCDGHLGHVFDDGPAPTGLRYCMNSAAMVFKPS